MSAHPYLDATRSPADRAADLVGRMELDEKLAQLGCVWCSALVEDGRFSAARAQALLQHGTGQVTRIGASTGLRPRESAAFANEIQQYLLSQTRLRIPALIHEESCAGFTARDATQFPQAIGLAATFDPDSVEAMARAIRRQMRAVGARHTLAPVLDVTRDPRWGRLEETYGEDAYLVSRLGAAYVRGIQGEDLGEGVAATGKHFLGYGLPEGGLNHAPAHVGPRELREVFARPFEVAIREAGLATVMNAYNEIDGLPCGGSAAILDDLLRGELGFDGPVVADYFAVALLETFHHIAADKGEAARRALEAGLDVELPNLNCFGPPLRAEIDAGRVKLETVDRAVRRHLRLKFELGLFEQPLVDAGGAPELYDTPEDRALARSLAQRSIVLLENEGDLLPLDPATSRVAVVGPCADDVRLLQGDYHYPAHLEIIYRRGDDAPPRGAADILPRAEEVAFAPGPFFVPTVTPLAGIRAAVSAETQVETAPGCDVLDPDESGIAEAVACAQRADVCVVCVGGRSGLVADCTSGEFRDAASLDLTGAQQTLVEAVVATGTRTVVVLVNGRVLALPWIAEHVPALLEAWLPGEEGGNAIADVLFGAVNPSGRLPITIPRSVGQVPTYYGHKSGAGRSQMLGDYADLPVSPLYPFGHGLSYTRFEYGPLDVSPAAVRADDRVAARFNLVNTGDRDGEEVVQLYARDPVATMTRPVQQLVGFARVAVPAGATREVTFDLDPRQLAFVDVDLRWILEPGTIELQLGASSADIRQRASFEVAAPTAQISSADITPTRVTIG